MAIVAAVSAFLLWLWYNLGFDHVDYPLDLILTVGWWAIIVGFAGYITRAESQRRKAIRTFYLSSTKAYNPELGTIEVAGADAQVNYMQEKLKDLKYSFGHHDAPDANDLACTKIVRTEDFKKDGTWKGSVETVGGGATQEFESAEQLKAILAI